MAAGKSGEIIIEGTTGLSIKLGWAEEYDPNTLKSRPRITSCHFKNGWLFGTWYMDGNISINGQSVVGMSSNPYTHMVRISDNNWYPIQEVNAGTNPPWYADWINHEPDGSLTVPISVSIALKRPSPSPQQNGTISGTQYIELTTIPVPKTLTFSNDAHSWVTVKKNGTTLTSGATVYYGDTLNITFGATPGYEVTATLNGAPIQSGATHTVTGDVSIAVTAEAQGLVYIDTGAQFEPAQIFIDNGSEWEQHMPFIDNGTEFELCS